MTMTRGERGQQIGPHLHVGAAPMARAHGTRGLVPRGQDGEE